MQAFVVPRKASDHNVSLTQSLHFGGKSDTCRYLYCTYPTELRLAIHKDNSIEMVMMMMIMM